MEHFTTISYDIQYYYSQKIHFIIYNDLNYMIMCPIVDINVKKTIYKNINNLSLSNTGFFN